MIPLELSGDERIQGLLMKVLKAASLDNLPIQVLAKAGSAIGPEDEGRVVVPVVAASWAHSDVTAALGKAKISKSVGLELHNCYACVKLEQRCSKANINTCSITEVQEEHRV